MGSALGAGYGGVEGSVFTHGHTLGSIKCISVGSVNEGLIKYSSDDVCFL